MKKRVTEKATRFLQCTNNQVDAKVADSSLTLRMTVLSQRVFREGSEGEVLLVKLRISGSTGGVGNIFP